MKFNLKSVRGLLCLTVLGMTTLMSNSFADTTINLFSVDGDVLENANVEIAITTDLNNDVTGFSYTRNGNTHLYTMDQVKVGVVLDVESGKNAISLSETKFDTVNGGPVVLTYLHNGITDDYETFSFNVVRQGATWASFVGKKSFSVMTLSANTFFGKTIGIDSISVH